MTQGSGAPVEPGGGADGRLTVLYNGDCPVCAAGIAVVRRNDRSGARINLIDVQATPEALAQAGITKDEVVRRLYTVDPGGRRRRGLAAFAAIGDAIPRLGWLSAVARLPLIGWLAHQGYERVLVPLLYRWNQARTRRRTGDPSTATDRLG